MSGVTCRECNGDYAVFTGIGWRACQSCLVPASVKHIDREPSQALTADDVRAAKLDRNPWNGEVHEELKLAVALQVLRSIRDEQIGASSAVKSLCQATLEVIGG